ncbi:hypothetical protein E2C01_085637 [Portunus trituberculatus]|uniref:Uncharacterized protein n=1 Tax=Portunus trituberculatus TaxID=210409 RepID=A0A5B7J1J9_PORTR|nr:hypothetical protein [Portunus trituberculatus]
MPRSAPLTGKACGGAESGMSPPKFAPECCGVHPTPVTAPVKTTSCPVSPTAPSPSKKPRSAPTCISVGGKGKVSNGAPRNAPESLTLSLCRRMGLPRGLGSLRGDPFGVSGASAE